MLGYKENDLSSLSGLYGYTEVNLALSSSWSANHEHRMSDGQQLFQLGHLQEHKYSSYWISAHIDAAH